eukprot:4801967-Prymnesium_polylepis.1
MADQAEVVLTHTAAGLQVTGTNKLPAVVDGWPRFPSVLQRYYETFTTSNHQSVHKNANGCAPSATPCSRRPHSQCSLLRVRHRLCVLGIAPTHPLLQSPAEITS